MTSEEVDEVQKESKETGQPQEKTFAYRWLRQALRVVHVLIGFSMIVFVTQAAILVAFPEKELIIPGQAIIYSSMGAVATALVGGEKIASKLKKSAGKVNV